ncbi:Ger(x)C family spore germination protein [Jeotgalibacillus soli]|uniref:Germination protein Ger(X)C n=1 Tax=Jeotgalibacillus soli TaxID=889306 RepID=A0A0C2VH68_9BACL|nr:Ger(x)C family spore germination protein [Jeotgalibacillus soli]KIL48222.1 germination protein Ger(x)C [Jeotgalibacillus soli]
MRYKKILLFLLIICITTISGCWNKKELNELSIISALGIDKNEEGEYVKTFQIINPKNVAGALQGGGGGQGPAVTVYSATGKTILDSHYMGSTKISRRLYMAHTNLLVISEELAREEGIIKILDAFERDPEIRPTTTIVIAHEAKAEDIVKSLTAIDNIPADKVVKTLETSERVWGGELKVTLQGVIKKLTDSGTDPLITGVRVIGDPEKGKKIENIQASELDATLEADGLAIFKNGKLINWLHGDNARGAVWVLDKLKKTIVNLEWEGVKDVIGYQVMRQNTEVSAAIKNEQPEITVHVRAEGDIREVRNPVKLSDPDVLRKIEKLAEKEIKRQIEGSVEFAKENKTDIFGFGDEVHRSYPDAWKDFGKDWQETVFPEIKVDVKVDAFIRRTGLRNNSYLSDYENSH